MTHGSIKNLEFKLDSKFVPEGAKSGWTLQETHSN